ncbi:MAG: CPBP family intramembrane glutamic endopeptidase [Spirochaetota bacterium]
MTTFDESLRGRGFELAAVLLTVTGFLALGISFTFIGAASVFWAIYVGARYRWDPTVFARWGFRREGFAAAVRLTLPFVLAAAVLCSGFAVVSERALLNWNFGLLLVLYPLWGTVQQFLLVALVAGNIVALGRGRIGKPTAIVITAVLFAAIHLPEYPLVGATFFMGLVTTSVYFRTRNLWVLGIFHGWVATVVYFLVMGTDPWSSLVLGGLRL